MATTCSNINVTGAPQISKSENENTFDKNMFSFSDEDITRYNSENSARTKDEISPNSNKARNNSSDFDSGHERLVLQAVDKNRANSQTQK